MFLQEVTALDLDRNERNSRALAPAKQHIDVVSVVVGSVGVEPVTKAVSPSELLGRNTLKLLEEPRFDSSNLRLRQGRVQG